MHSTDLSDKEIITRILDGEKELYLVLMKRHHSLVFYVAQQFHQNGQEQVSEIAHEIFVKAYEQLASYENRSAFSSWLYRLARNYCIDKIRRNKRHNLTYLEMPGEYSDHMATDEPDPGENLSESESAAKLQKGLEKIGEQYSVPLLMKYRDGMSYDAISNALDISEGALKVRVHRARKELKQYMEQK